MWVCVSMHTRAMRQACPGMCPALVTPGWTSALSVLRQGSLPSLFQEEEASLKDQGSKWGGLLGGPGLHKGLRVVEFYR